MNDGTQFDSAYEGRAIKPGDSLIFECELLEVNTG
jgi:FKBP-type peptidyl-prolyl cis-trans isomerase